MFVHEKYSHVDSLQEMTSGGHVNEALHLFLGQKLPSVPLLKPLSHPWDNIIVNEPDNVRLQLSFA